MLHPRLLGLILTPFSRPACRVLRSMPMRASVGGSRGRRAVCGGNGSLHGQFMLGLSAEAPETSASSTVRGRECFAVGGARGTPQRWVRIRQDQRSVHECGRRQSVWHPLYALVPHWTPSIAFGRGGSSYPQRAAQVPELRETEIEPTRLHCEHRYPRASERPASCCTHSRHPQRICIRLTTDRLR